MQRGDAQISVSQTSALPVISHKKEKEHTTGVTLEEQGDQSFCRNEESASSKIPQCRPFSDETLGYCSVCGHLSIPARKAQLQQKGSTNQNVHNGLFKRNPYDVPLMPDTLSLLAPKMQSKQDCNELQSLLKKLDKSAAIDKNGDVTQAAKTQLREFVKAHWDELYLLLICGRKPVIKSATKAVGKEDRVGACRRCGASLNLSTFTHYDIKFVQSVFLEVEIEVIDDITAWQSLQVIANGAMSQSLTEGQRQIFDELKQLAIQTVAAHQKARLVAGAVNAIMTISKQLATYKCTFNKNTTMQSIERAFLDSDKFKAELNAAITAVTTETLETAQKAVESLNLTTDTACNSAMVAMRLLSGEGAQYTKLITCGVFFTVKSIQDYAKEIGSLVEKSKLPELEVDLKEAETVIAANKEAHESVQKISSSLAGIESLQMAVEHIWKLADECRVFVETENIMKCHRDRMYDVLSKARDARSQALFGDTADLRNEWFYDVKVCWVPEKGVDLAPQITEAKEGDSTGGLTLATTPPTSLLDELRLEKAQTESKLQEKAERAEQVQVLTQSPKTTKKAGTRLKLKDFEAILTQKFDELKADLQEESKKRKADFDVRAQKLRAKFAESERLLDFATELIHKTPAISK